MDAPSHALYGQMPFLTTEAMAAMWHHYHPARPAHPLASIMQYPDLAGLPAAVLVTAELDILRDEGGLWPAPAAGRRTRFQPSCARHVAWVCQLQHPGAGSGKVAAGGLYKAVFWQDIGCWTSLIHATVHVYSYV
jgi:acetyl esterase/lipase